MAKKFTLIGFTRMTFTSASGDEVKGLNLAFSTPIDSKVGEGEDVERCFLSQKKLDNLSSPLTLGASYTLVYNKYGKIDDLISV